MDSVRCVLHPLALVSVCDSETRLRKGGSKLPTNAPLIGLLFGPVTNGVISICDGANAVYEFDTERGTQLNLPRIAERKTLWCTVYPSHELVGWFSVGVAIEDWYCSYTCTSYHDPYAGMRASTKRSSARCSSSATLYSSS